MSIEITVYAINRPRTAAFRVLKVAFSLKILVLIVFQSFCKCLFWSINSTICFFDGNPLIQSLIQPLKYDRIICVSSLDQRVYFLSRCKTEISFPAADELLKQEKGYFQPKYKLFIHDIKRSIYLSPCRLRKKT